MSQQIHKYRKGGPKFSTFGASGTMRAFSTGGGSGTLDATARAQAAAAQNAINAIVPEPNEVIQPGQYVFHADGTYQNATGSAITLSGTNPVTGASLLADGLTSAMVSTDTGTNITVPQSAFAAVEIPTLVELNTWRTANVGTGLTVNLTQTPDDLYLYTSPLGKSFTWAAGDAEGADIALIASNDPNAGGFEQITLSTNAAITPNPNPGVLKSIELTATTPVVVFETRNVVEYPVNAPTDTNQRIDLIRNSTEDIRLVGTFSNVVNPIMNLNGRNVMLKAMNDLSGWTLSTGGT